MRSLVVPSYVPHRAPEICGLINLRELDVSNNTELKFLPSDIGELRNLECLKASRCSLTELPDSLADLKKTLKVLHLGNNLLVKFPPCISQLEALEDLDLIFKQHSTGWAENNSRYLPGEQ